MKRLLILLATLSLCACSLEVAGPVLVNPGPSDPTKDVFVGFEPPIVVSQMTKTAAGTYYRDEKVGTGAELLPSTSVIVYRFAAWLPRGGQSFDASNGSRTVPIVNLLGGLRDALPGMRVGGERTFVIPSELAFGPSGLPGLVPGNSTVVYTVFLEGIP